MSRNKIGFPITIILTVGGIKFAERCVYKSYGKEKSDECTSILSQA